MKLRRRDPHQTFIPETYHTLKHDGSDQILKKFRTLAALNTLNAQSIKRAHKPLPQTQKTLNSQNQQSRLRRMQKKHESSKVLSVANQLINVNSFKHLTQVHYMDCNQIKWAFGLRTHDQPKSKRSLSQIPSTYYKTTESSKVLFCQRQNHHQVSQMPTNLNFNMFMHLAKQGQHPSMGLLRFETTLRESGDGSKKKSPEMLEKERSFITIPVKDKNEYPKLLSSQSIKKKTINPQRDMETAFDGSHRYPSYTDRIIKEKNYNNIRQQLRNPPRSKVNLPSIGWQTNLRIYEADKHKKIEQKA